MTRQHRDDRRPDPCRPPRPGTRDRAQDQPNLESPTSPDPSPRPVTLVPEPARAGQRQLLPAGQTPPPPARQAQPAPTAGAAPATARQTRPAPPARTRADLAARASARPAGPGRARPAANIRPNRPGNRRGTPGPLRNAERHHREHSASVPSPPARKRPRRLILTRQHRQTRSGITSGFHPDFRAIR